MTHLIAPVDLPGGARVWMAPETQDFVQRLEALDPRLALVQEPGNRWSIWRVPEDGSPPRGIMRSKSNAKLDPQVIEMLRQRDTRSGHDPVEEIIRANAQVIKHAEDADVERRFLAIDHMLSKAWKGRVPSNIEDLDI